MDVSNINKEQIYKRLRQIVIDSEPRLSKFIREMNKRIKHGNVVRADYMCDMLNVDIYELSRILYHKAFDAKIVRPSDKIKAYIFSGLILEIEKIRSEELPKRIYDKSMCELIVSSDSLLAILDSDAEHVRLSKLSTMLNLGINHICKLFENENIVIEYNPNTKISCVLLRHFILKEPEISIPLTSIDALIEGDLLINDVVGIAVEDKLADLNNKIQKIDNKIYTKSIVLNQFIRNEYIREYSKVRAVGICELCEKPAPFIDNFGVPFLESHHVVLLSRGGKDSIDNVVALCPNCHKKIHNLNLDSDVKKLLDKLEKHANTIKITA